MYSTPTETVERNGETRNWYVARVNANHEKSVARMFDASGYGGFVPLVKRSHYYGRRVREYQIPLFAGYVFCHATGERIASVTHMPSVIDVLRICNVPAVVPDAEIDNLRIAARSASSLSPWPYIESGSTVRITEGAFSGITGILLDYKPTSMRVVLSITLLRRSVLLDMSAAEIEKVA
jgi:transcriptional antiterminator RfaH